MVARKGFAAPSRDYSYPYPVYRSPILGAGSPPQLFSRNRASSMGLTTVIRDYGTEILNAIRENDVQKLKYILEKTLRSDSKIAKLCVTDIKHKPTKKFACPLILAARQEDSRIMKYMMDKGTDPNFVHHTIFSSKRREIVTALHLAVDLGFYDTTEVLLNANADANIYDHNQETPLHIAVKKADHTMTKLLLSKGADPAIPDRKNNAALHIATLYGHLQMVRTLLKYDADIYQKGQWDAIPPHIAAKEGHIHLIQLFSSKDIANINVKIPCYADRREKAPLHLAAENGHVECLLVLLDQFDADVNLKDSDGNTALHCVVLHPYDVHRMRDREYFTESAKTLLKFRVSINEKNVFGDTALHFAAMNHYHRIVELLLEMGANPFLENEDGMKPIDTVPDSDPVTKQILKMAMMRGRPSADVSMEHHRRLIDSTLNVANQMNASFDRASRSNVSHRSVSSMSSVFVDDAKAHRSRHGDGHRSKSRSKSQTKIEEPEPQDHEQNADVYQSIENEVPVYSKVDKKKSKHKGGRDSNSNLGYDQREWEEISTTTVNDESAHGSVISQSVRKPLQVTQEVQADIHRRNRHQQTAMVETVEVGTQQDFINKKNKKNKQRKPSSENEDISLDMAIPEPQDQPAPRRVGQVGEVIYENLPPQGPPLPPRRNRPTPSTAEEQQQEAAQGDFRTEDGVQIHTLPGRPGTIEVQYKGGPIRISVDTPKEYYEDGEEVSEEEKPVKSPKRKKKDSKSPKKQGASPKTKRKEDLGFYYDQEEQENISQKPKYSQKQRHKSDEQEQEPAKAYYNEYYQQKYVKKKPKPKQVNYDQYIELEQSIEDYFNGTYDITELETLQQSMISEASQPELVKKIIQQKIAELTEQKAKDAEKKSKGMRGQRTDRDKMQMWLTQAEQDEEEEDDDSENILDSDEWNDDEEFHEDEFHTPDEGLEDDYEPNSTSQGPMESTPLKQQKGKRQQNEEQEQETQMPYSPKVRTKEDKEAVKPPTPKVKSPSKTRPQIQITKEPAKPIHSIKVDDSASHDDDASISPDDSPNNSPQPMSFKEKLKWAQGLDSGGEGGPPPTAPKPASYTPKKSGKPVDQIVSTPEGPKWKVKPGQKTTVVESTSDKVSETTDEQRSRDMDGDDEHEDDSSGISDLTRKLSSNQGMYYSITQDIDAYSSTSSATAVSSTVGNVRHPQAPKQEPIQEIDTMGGGSPFSRRKPKPAPRKESSLMQEQDPTDVIQYNTEPVSPRRRTKSQNDILDVEEQKRAVSPVTLKDIGSRGERTASVASEGRGLGLRISGNVPKAYNHKDRASARTAFMLASPVRIESSSECSDSELRGSKGSLSDLGYYKDRGRLWADPLAKPVYPKHTSDMVGTSPKPENEQDPRSDDSSEKGKKIIGGYAKPYKSFGKIDVKTDLIEEAMLNSSIPEDRELDSDLEALDVSDLEDEDEQFSGQPGFKVQTNSQQTPEVIRPPTLDLAQLDQEPGGARYPRQVSRENSIPPPLPLNSPPAMPEMDEPQLSPRSDTSSKSGRKVVSLREEKTNARGEIIQTVTTTVIKHEVPQATMIHPEMVAPTDDLSFGDSTFDDDLDDMVRENVQVKVPSELPPPPPELMHTDDSQEILEPFSDQTNKISVHVEEVDENEAAQYMQKAEKVRRKSKSKKSTENLSNVGETEVKKKKKKKKPKTQDEQQTNEIQIKQISQIEKYDTEPGVADPKKGSGVRNFQAGGQEGVPMKPSESKEFNRQTSEDLGIMDYDDEPGSRRPRQKPRKPEVEDKRNDGNKPDLGIMDYAEEPGARHSRSREKPHARLQDAKRMENLGIMDYNAEPGARKPKDTVEDNSRQKSDAPVEPEVNKSITDMEVAEITDQAEVRRKAREAARAQREWHKKMIEEGKDPKLYMKSRSHSRETSKERHRQTSKERHGLKGQQSETSTLKERKTSPSPTRRNVRSSPNSYTIVVEGDAEVTTSKGKLQQPPSPLEPLGGEQEGGLMSLGSKRGKKKKTKKSTESLIDDGEENRKKKKKKKMGSTDDLAESQETLSGEKKKKKKKKTGSRDDLTSVGKGSIEDLTPKGTVQGVPPETAITDVWKEAMSGQPLASSETVYQVDEDEGQLNVGTEVRRSKRGKKKKKKSVSETEEQVEIETNEQNKPQQVPKPPPQVVQLKPGESPSSMEVSDPSLEHMIKRAVVPKIPKGVKHSYDFESDDNSEETGSPAPTLTIGAGQKTNQESKKKQKKLDKLGKKYKVAEDVAQSTQNEQEDLLSLERPPRSVGQVEQPVKPHHAVNLHHASDEGSSEESDGDEPVPGNFVHRAQVPKGRRPSYETNLDDPESMDEDKHGIPTMNLTDAQRAEILKTRELKKQQQMREIAIARQQQQEAEQQLQAQQLQAQLRAQQEQAEQERANRERQVEMDELQEPPRPGRIPGQASIHQQQPERQKFGIQLTQEQDDSGSEDEDSLPGQFVKRVNVPVVVSGQRGIYETSLDDSEEPSREQITDINLNEEQRAELRKAKEVRRLQQSMDKIARRRQEEEREKEEQRQLEEQERQKQLYLEEQARLEAQFEDLDEPPRPAYHTRPQHAIQLAHRQDNTPDDEDSLPESMIRRADIPQKAYKKFEISQEDSDTDQSEDNQAASIGLSDAQKVALAKAREEKRMMKAQEKKERNRKQQAEEQERIQLQMERDQLQESIEPVLPKHPGQPQPQRPQYAMGLAKPGAKASFETDPDDSVPESMIRRAGIPAIDKRQSYETNLDDLELGSSEEDRVPTIGLSDSQKSAMASIREAKRQQKVQASLRKREQEQREQEQREQEQREQEQREQEQREQEVDEEGYLVPLPYDEQHRQTQDPSKPQRPHYSMNLNQPYQEDEYSEIDDPMPDDMIRRVKPPNLPPRRQGSLEGSLDDLEAEHNDQPPVISMKGGKPKPAVARKPGQQPQHMETNFDDDDDTFKNAAFSALRGMQGQKPQVTKKPQFDSNHAESPDFNKAAFSRSSSGRIRIPKGSRPPIVQGKEVFIDRQPDLMGEDALPPDGNTDDQLQQELAKLRGEVPKPTQLMSERWQGKKDQESEMQLILQAIQDPSELDDMASMNRPRGDGDKPFRGRLPPPPTEPLPSARSAAPATITDLNSNQQHHTPPGGRSSYKPPRHPSASRPPRGSHMNDSLLSNQSSPGKDEQPNLRGRSNSPNLRGRSGSPRRASPGPPRVRVESPGRPRSNSDGKQYNEFEHRPRSDSEGRSPRPMQPVKRRIRRAYPSEGDLPGHQSDSEALKRSRRGKSISFYGDFRRSAREKRDKAPVMKASQSLEEAAWSQIRQDMDNQPKLRAHRVIKPQGDKPINYTRGVYRPTPVYWRGSQRSIANTSRYDDSELIDQLWQERMGTESEGDADLEDMSYDANMPDQGEESVQFGSYDRFGSSQFSQSIPDDERLRMAQYNSQQFPTSAPPYVQENQYFGAFQPVGPPKHVTIVDKKKRKPVRKDKKDLPPRIIDSGPVDFNKYGATAKLWMEQVGRSETQKSKTMYLATMGDQQPPAEIMDNMPKDRTGTSDQGAQWVIARGRSLQMAKYDYDRQRSMNTGAEPDQGPLDPGKQMLLFFKIGENWKDLAWVLFDGLLSDGDILRMLKEIQHRHPDKVNDQVHDMMHRWWQKKGSAATIEELQQGLEVLKMAYVEEEYLNPRGIFSEVETEPEVEISTASEDDAEVNRLIHDYKNRSLNGSFENKNAYNSGQVRSPTENNNSGVNAGSLLRKLEEATIDHVPSKINRSSITRPSPQPGSRPRYDSHEGSDFDASGDGTHPHSFVIVQPQLNSKDYKHETNM